MWTSVRSLKKHPQTFRLSKVSTTWFSPRCEAMDFTFLVSAVTYIEKSNNYSCKSNQILYASLAPHWESWIFYNLQYHFWVWCLKVCWFFQKTCSNLLWISSIHCQVWANHQFFWKGIRKVYHLLANQIGRITETIPYLLCDVTSSNYSLQLKPILYEVIARRKSVNIESKKSTRKTYF